MGKLIKFFLAVMVAGVFTVASTMPSWGVARPIPDNQRFQPETPGLIIKQDKDRVERYMEVQPPEETKKKEQEKPPEKGEGSEPGGKKQ